jgi:hypothetical protein
MGGLGCMFSILAGFFLLVGLIPLLGWLNWLTTLPLSALAIMFSYLAVRERPGDSLARVALIAGVLIFATGAFRLSLGAGIL